VSEEQKIFPSEFEIEVRVKKISNSEMKIVSQRTIENHCSLANIFTSVPPEVLHKTMERRKKVLIQDRCS